MENKKVKEALYELSIQTDKENVYQDKIFENEFCYIKTVNKEREEK